MNIERVKVLKALKCGDMVYKKGQIIDRPIPPDIVQEVRNDTGTVEVLSETTSTVSEEEIIEKIEPEEVKSIEEVPEEEIEISKDEPSPIIEEKAETEKDEKVLKPTSVLKSKSRKSTKKKKTVRKKVVRSNK